jgi:hypothetical protein
VEIKPENEEEEEEGGRRRRRRKRVKRRRREEAEKELYMARVYTRKFAPKAKADN